MEEVIMEEFVDEIIVEENGEIVRLEVLDVQDFNVFPQDDEFSNSNKKKTKAKKSTTKNDINQQKKILENHRCNVCSKMYEGRLPLLIKHLRAHYNIKVKCNECGKLVNRGHLLRHKRALHGDLEKPVKSIKNKKCPECTVNKDRLYTDSGLKQHFRKIHKEKYLMHFGTMKANEALDYDSDDLQRKKDERKSIEDRLKILNQNIHDIEKKKVKKNAIARLDSEITEINEM